jgi:hypothetical protein
VTSPMTDPDEESSASRLAAIGAHEEVDRVDRRRLLLAAVLLPLLVRFLP